MKKIQPFAYIWLKLIGQDRFAHKIYVTDHWNRCVAALVLGLPVLAGILHDEFQRSSLWQLQKLFTFVLELNMTDIPFKIVFCHIGIFFFFKSLPGFPLSDFQVNHQSSTWKGSVYLLSRCGGVIAFEAVEPSLHDTQDIPQLTFAKSKFFREWSEISGFFFFFGAKTYYITNKLPVLHEFNQPKRLQSKSVYY